MKREIKYAIKSAANRGNYYLDNYKEKIWLVGSGRSGTTWASGMINWDGRYREIYEPFHPDSGEPTKRFCPHIYVRPDDAEHPVRRAAAEVFSGRLMNRRINLSNRFRLKYEGLFIKDIFCNLFACWAGRTFPEVKIIFLVRNPFAVALSKYKMRQAFWMTDPGDFLDQKELVEDYLYPFEDVIGNVGDDFIERQMLIWSIIHYVPFRQFDANRIHFLFYEDMYRNPREELRKLHDYIDSQQKYENDETGWEEAFKRPSRSSKQISNLVEGKSPVSAWRNELSARQIDNGYRILEKFGLDRLYADLYPNRRVLDELLSGSKEAIRIGRNNLTNKAASLMTLLYLGLYL
jgi:hypothetical protein